jgi:hypothetical protein
VGSGSARPVRPHPRADLAHGVVPGGAFVREPGSPGVPTTTADGGSSPEEAPATAQAVPVVAAPPAAPAAPTPPPPPPAVANPEPAPAPAVADPAPAPDPEPPTANSSRDTAPHPAPPPPTGNTPAARPDNPARPANGHAAPARRPSRETSLSTAPIGVLRCADGPTVPLDRSYVVGRDPQKDPSVTAGLATPITVGDPTNLISRVHAFVTVDDGVVHVRDAPSVSGTYLAEPGAAGWTRVGTGPTVLPPGWHLRIGTKVFVFEPTTTPTS